MQRKKNIALEKYKCERKAVPHSFVLIYKITPINYTFVCCFIKMLDQLDAVVREISNYRDSSKCNI